MFPITLVAQSALFVSAANVVPSCLRIIRTLECPLVAGITEAFQHHAVPWGACIAFPAGTGKGWRDVPFSRSNASTVPINRVSAWRRHLCSQKRTCRICIIQSTYGGCRSRIHVSIFLPFPHPS